MYMDLGVFLLGERLMSIVPGTLHEAQFSDDLDHSRNLFSPLMGVSGYPIAT